MILKELVLLESTPELEEFGDDIDELIKLKYAIKAWDIDTPWSDGTAASHLHGYWLYDGYDEDPEKPNTAKKPKIVATVVDSSGEHQNAGPFIYVGRKVTDKQALRWYIKDMKDGGRDDD